MSRRVVLPLDRQCELLHFPKPVAEYKFHALRKWRLDWAWPSPLMLAVEVEGGAFTNGRHTRGAGFVADMEKYNAAVLNGWKVLRFTPSQIANGEALPVIALALRRLEQATPAVTHSSGD